MNDNRVAVYPGSFDPPTNGHIHVLSQAAELFDTVHTLIASNADKVALLPAEDRAAIFNWEVEVWQRGADLSGVRAPLVKVHVMEADDLTVLAAKKLGATHVVRGVRNTMDWAYEQTLQHAYAELADAHGVPKLTFVYFGAPLNNELYTSSSLVRGLMKSRNWRTSLRPFVPGSTFGILEKRHGDRD